MEEPIPARQRKPLPRRVGDARAEEVLRAPGKTWRAGRVAEGSGLENRRRGNSTGGSNPSLSAKQSTICLIYLALSRPQFGFLFAFNL